MTTDADQLPVLSVMRSLPGVPFMPVKPRPVSEAPPDPLLLPIEDVAAMLGVSWDKVYRLVRDGALPSRYIGSRRVIEATAVHEYVASLPTERGA
jgi:excisionase family DNA binding protein